MVHTGVEYTPGQLLAVVTPATLVVVDAPTDWSLAGPLWELALDDAPIDEILDCLIRRGIRTAPTFAVVRVEDVAVRILVRGPVRVGVERVGDPVRLDASGATTWLEAVVSTPRRVLVGAVDPQADFPYLVATGVVLISGLVLPCVPEAARSARTPQERQGSLPPAAPSSEPGSAASPDALPAPSSPGSAPGSAPGRAPARPQSPVGGPADSPSSSVPAATPAPAPTQAPAAAPHVGAPSSPPAPVPASAEAGAGPGAQAQRPASQPEDAPAGPASAPPDRAPAAIVDLTRLESPVGAGVLAGRSAWMDPPPPPSARPSPPRPVVPLGDAPSGRGSDRPGFRPADRSGDRPAERPPDAPAQSPAERPERPIGRTSIGPPPEDRPLHRQDPPLPQRPLPERRAAERPAAARPADERRAFERPARPSVPGPSGIEGRPGADVRARTGGPGGDTAADGPPSRGPSPVDLPSLDPPSVPVPLSRGDQPRPTESPRPAEPDRPAGQPRPGAEPPGGESAKEAKPEGAQSPVSRLGLPLRIRGQSMPPDLRARLQASQSQPGAGRNGTHRDATSQAGEQSSAFVRPFPQGEAGQGEGGPGQQGQQGDGQSGGQPGGKATHLRAVPTVPAGDSGGGSATPNPPLIRPVAPGERPEAGSSGSPPLPAFFRGTRVARGETAGSGGLSRPTPEGAPYAPAPAPPPKRPYAQGGPVDLEQSGGSREPAGSAPRVPGVLRPVGEEDSGQNRSAEGESQAAGDDAPAASEAPREPQRLLGVWCDSGHVTSPDKPKCRVCGLDVPPQAPILVARPTLGVLVFDSGERMPLERPIILGRDPKPVASPDPEAPMLHQVQSATGQVSRTHAEVRADGWDVVITDLEAMNGTTVTSPGGSAEQLKPGSATVIAPGTRVDLGGETGFVLEVDA